MRILFTLLLLATTINCSAKPTEPVILVEAVFSGRALLDVNGNGELDSQDTPIENASFYVEWDGVKVFSGTTQFLFSSSETR
jgi:hypothetical protein